MSNPVFTRPLLIPAHNFGAATGELLRPSGPPVTLYGHVRRHKLHTDWTVTEGRNGRILRSGTAWTRQGAWTKATAAAHDPNILNGPTVRGAR